MAIDVLKIREELEVFLRNADVMSVVRRGVSTYVDVFTAYAGQTTFTLTKPGVKNIRLVKKNGTPILRYVQYTPDYHEGKIVLSTPASVGNTIEITYDAGVGDKIYSDLPRLDISLDSYPRVGFDDISHANTEQALGGSLIRTDILISLIVYAATKEECLEIWQSCRDAILANKKSFHFFQFITLAGAGPMAKSAGRHEKIVQKNQDFRIPFEFEATT